MDAIDGFFRLFPYLLTYRFEEVAGSSPTRSTHKSPSLGILLLSQARVPTPHSPCAQAVPFGVVDTWEQINICFSYPKSSLMLFPPVYISSRQIVGERDMYSALLNGQ
jgi:hypothetical protein